MKHTEKSIRALVSAANAQSKSRGVEVGLHYERTAKGHIVRVVYRANGFVHWSLEELSASEAAAAVAMFRSMMEV